MYVRVDDLAATLAACSQAEERAAAAPAPAPAPKPEGSRLAQPPQAFNALLQGDRA